MSDDEHAKLFRHERTPPDEPPHVTVDPTVEGDPVNPRLFGKFTEHLGWNVNHGMDANATYNPTFGRWHFRAPDATPDGGYDAESDPAAVRDRIRADADDRGLPAAEPLWEAHENGCAYPWLPRGERVTTTADTGPTGDRAQRVETGGADEGLLQWLSLPLQRTEEYEFALRARATGDVDLDIAVHALDDAGEPTERLGCADVRVERDWTTVEGPLTVDAGGRDPDAVYGLSVTAREPANVVIDRLTLYPDDHVNRADPDVVALYRERDLPLLRWPGGNFVSGYDWRDGIGPVADRPTRKNPAWTGLEPNLFGTAEFVAFCRAVGAEPSICVNAGDGTPAEAAAWVEYCNGDPESTELGALRAEHGYEEPFDVRYWELGNELWGRHQVRWTTPAGNADRYERFHDAVTAVDPDVKLQACGFRHDEDWNPTLAREVPAEKLRAITTHPLAGGSDVSRATEPAELFHAFMGFPHQLRETFERFLGDLREGGVRDPKLAVTELQLFASLADEADDDAAVHRLTEDEMPTPTTLAEALYDAGVINECVRIGDAVEMLTHSAAVNHGGGLQKRRERVFPDPCHYGHEMAAQLAGRTPLGVVVRADGLSTDQSFGEIEPLDGAPAVDAMAAVGDGALVVLLVGRRADAGTRRLTVDCGAVDGAPADATAAVTTLTADAFHAENGREDPDNVAPETTDAPVTDGEASVPLPSPSLVTLRIPLADE